MRKPAIAANWKMYKTVQEAKDFIAKFVPLVNAAAGADRDVILCMPFTALYAAGQALKGSNVRLGAENMYFEDKGAFTGEISPSMLKDVGCSYVILGHSERRKIFKEDDALINKKMHAALKAGLTPIVCIGETIEERESGKMFSVLETQVNGSMAGLSPADAERIIIAYEPVWAIGTGKTATTAQAQEAHVFVRKVFAGMYPQAAEKVRIQYGGSVKPENMKDLMSQTDVDGGLVGGASLDPESFAKIVLFDK